MWGATPVGRTGVASEGISIHAPRVGSDSSRTNRRSLRRNFNPRSPCGERPRRAPKPCNKKLFQSTLPVWGATTGKLSIIMIKIDFNPRSPCGERLPTGKPTFVGSSISIHAPRVGSDSKFKRLERAKPNFNPRSPCGERPVNSSNPASNLNISIHAPRVGSDTIKFLVIFTLTHFNPRSPCGERQQRCTNFKVHLWQRGRIFAFLREERRDSHQAAALRDRFFDGNLGANLPAFSVYYGFAVRESRRPPAYSCSCSQNAPPSFHTGCPDSKTAASPFLRP